MKAQKVRADCQRLGYLSRLWVPKLPDSPFQAICVVKRWAKSLLRVNKDHRFAFIGSSLGGLYATWLGQCFPTAQVVLLNPAVRPSQLLASQVGLHQSYSSADRIHFLPRYVKQLQRLEQVQLTHLKRYFLVAAQHDEVLSYQQMVVRYENAHCLTVKGGDHALSEFDEYWPFIRLFLGLVP